MGAYASTNNVFPNGDVGQVYFDGDSATPGYHITDELQNTSLFKYNHPDPAQNILNKKKHVLEKATANANRNTLYHLCASYCTDLGNTGCRGFVVRENGTRCWLKNLTQDGIGYVKPYVAPEPETKAVIE